MAEIADLRLLEEELATLECAPYLSHHYAHGEFYSSDPDPFPPRLSELVPLDRSVHAQIVVDEDDVDEREARFEIDRSDDSDSDSVTDLNYFTRQNRQVNLSMDLFDFERCPEPTHVLDISGSVQNPYSDEPGFRILDGNEEIGSNYLELGLGLGFDRVHGDEDDDNDGFMIADSGGDFFVSRREEPAESSPLELFGDVLQVVGIGSDSDEEERRVVEIDLNSAVDDGFDQAPDDLILPLCWDCLRLEDQRESNEEFEWEEVDVRVDELEVLSMVIDGDGDRSVSTEIQSEEVGGLMEEAMRNLEWEVLSTVNNLERNLVLESYMAIQDDDIYTAEYELLFGQFAENESFPRGSPPAAKSVVENLPSIILTQQHVQNNNALCAVCKDEISMEEQAKQLPCSHYYHGDCILPWLNIRNTCPVCRYELPTDDPEYEQWRIQRAGHHL